MLAFAEFLQNYFIIPVGMLIFVLWIGFKFYSKYIKPAKKLSGQLSVLGSVENYRELITLAHN